MDGVGIRFLQKYSEVVLIISWQNFIKIFRSGDIPNPNGFHLKYLRRTYELSLNWKLKIAQSGLGIGMSFTDSINWLGKDQLKLFKRVINAILLVILAFIIGK